MEHSLTEVTEAIRELELDRIAPLVREALERGAPPTAVLDAMTAGMVAVGEAFHEGEYFLADLVVAAEGMKEGLEILAPRLDAQGRGNRGTVVLCTVAGDTHDIGKNLVARMLTSSGFEVVDLGVDVPAERVIEAVRRHRARAVGLSVLLTPMVASIASVVSGLTEAGLRDQVKIAIGGACTTEELGRRLGIDAVGRDAVQAVGVFESFLRESTE